MWCIKRTKKKGCKRKEKKEKVIIKKKKEEMFVCLFFLCMLLNKKNEFNLYAQISEGQIKIMLYFPKNVEHVSTYILGINNWFFKA